MHPFSYHHPVGFRDAADRPSDPASFPVGGGTGLLVRLEEGLAEPGVLVDLPG